METLIFSFLSIIGHSAVPQLSFSRMAEVGKQGYKATPTSMAEKEPTVPKYYLPK